MGLRLSLDSSESESNGGPTSTSRMYTSYHQPHDRTPTGVSLDSIVSGPDSLGPRRSGGEPTTDLPHVTDSISLRDLVRELRSMNSDENPVYRLFYPQSTRDSRTPSRPGAYRSNSMSNPIDPSHPTASGSGEPIATGRLISTGRQRVAPSGSGHHRHRTSCLDLNTDVGASRAHGRRNARRSGPVGTTAVARWDSSDSDTDDFDFVNNLHLSSLLFRHLQSGSSVRATYNVDRLTQNTGECAICLEDLAEGDLIARLQCLCVYHKKCIDSWFKRRPVCPVHPGDD
ncbi:E3 ubiquitin-protein ligase znrf1 [Clonorchis sinensis]|uniref:RING-type E3 ubiquitin transferase n=1 Tax=Clonorchis sinensis TaxID=79923 RepID=A0A419PX31_CLOSI|nr:E3 ubiquitin-protein ligase znrf1 [Clonorchis sinensis]